jgi:hypothetical protein
MSHLILTTNDLAPLQLQATRLANVVLGFSVRFVMDRLPSEEQLMMGAGAAVGKVRQCRRSLARRRSAVLAERFRYTG